MKTTKLKHKLWKVFSLYIRLKYADEYGFVKCVTCGARKFWKQIHAGHYVAKNRGLSLYFDERNVHPQCPGCNLFKRGNLDQYALFLRKTYGEEILEDLDHDRQLLRQIKAPEYEELIKEYKDKVKSLGDKEEGEIFGKRS